MQGYLRSVVVLIGILVLFSLAGCLGEGDDELSSSGSESQTITSEETQLPVGLFAAPVAAPFTEMKLITDPNEKFSSYAPPQSATFGGAPGHSGVSMVQGSDGALYVLADNAGKLLLYRYAQGEAVTSEQIADSATKPDLAVDENGYFHVVYYNTNDNLLMYTNNLSGVWQAETIVDSIDAGRSSSPMIALGADSVSVGYGKYTAGEISVLFATNSTGEWQVEEVDQINDIYVSTISFTLDSYDNAHFSYYRYISSDAYASELMHAEKVIDVWVKTVIDESSNDTFPASEIHITPSGVIYVLYGIGGKYKIAKYTDGLWQIINPFVDSQYKYVPAASMRLDENEDIHLAFVYYKNSSNIINHLGFATNASEAWTFENLAADFTQVEFPSLLLVGNKATVAFFQTKEGRLALAEKPVDEWTIEQLDRSMNIKSVEGFRLDADGVGHVVFTNEMDNLFYAVSTVNGWEGRRIAKNVDNIQFVLDAQGQSHVAFLNLTDKTINYMYEASGLWKSTVVSTTESAFALTTDNQGIAYIVYQDLDYLTHVSRYEKANLIGTNSAWPSIDAIPPFMTVSLDSQNILRLVFIRSELATYVRIATQINGQWFDERLYDENWGSWTDQPTGPPAFIVDSQGNYHYSNGRTYKTDTSGVWSFEGVTPQETKYADLYLTAEENPVLTRVFNQGAKCYVDYLEDDQWINKTIYFSNTRTGKVKAQFDSNHFFNVAYVSDDAIRFEIRTLD